jgi:glucans biosynthesis protein C
MSQSKSNRLYYMDYLKILMTLLVVIHHIARAYGPWGFWYYKEPPSSLIPGFIPFFAINAGFLMSFFFFLSGFFMGGSYDRKGPKGFAQDRNRRFLVPLMIFVLIIMPIQMYTHYIFVRNYASIPFFEYYGQFYLGFGEQPSDWAGPYWPDIQLGHIWFLEHLLFYGLFYQIWRRIQAQKGTTPALKLSPRTEISVPSDKVIMVTLIFLIGITFCIRIISPLNKWIGLFEFIQIEFAHLPHYIAFLFFGIAAYRHHWIDQISKRRGYIWLSIGIITALIMYLIYAIAPFDYDLIVGGVTWASLLYTSWETVLLFSLVIGILVLFREKWNVPNESWQKVSNTTYLVYLIHVPIILCFQYLFARVLFPTSVKFIIVAICSIPIIFLIAWWLKKRGGIFRFW